MSKINEYHCEQSHITITKDTEPRTITPMFITCPECKGRAYSRMYQVNQYQQPTYQWFIPESIDELKDACLPVYGDVFSEDDYEKMFKMQDNNGPGMYRKINIISKQ